MGSTPNFFCVTWNNYRNHLSEYFSTLFTTKQFTDVILYAENKIFECHRVVLCAGSPYFRELLGSISVERPIIILAGIKAEDIKVILDYIYHGEIKNVDSKRFASVIRAAGLLKIYGLAEVTVVQSSGLLHRTKNRGQTAKAHTNNEDGLVNDKRSSSVEVNVSKNAKVTIVKPTEEESTAHASKETPDKHVSDDDIVDLVHDNDDVVHVNDNDDNDAETSGDLEIVDDPSLVNNSLPCEENNLAARKKNIKSESENNNISVRRNIHKPTIVMSYTTENNQPKLVSTFRIGTKKSLRSGNFECALKEVEKGTPLPEVAKRYNIPRSTLYAKAKNHAGLPIITRKDHSNQDLTPALQAIADGLSLKQASEQFNIPKTVLWRRVQKRFDISNKVRGRRKNLEMHNKSEGKSDDNQRNDESGNSTELTDISIKDSDPANYSDENCELTILEPEVTIRSEPDGEKESKRARLSEAVEACKTGQMSQALASATYQVPKTTIWRRLKKQARSQEISEKQRLSLEKIKENILEKQKTSLDVDHRYTLLARQPRKSTLKRQASQLAPAPEDPTLKSVKLDSKDIDKGDDPSDTGKNETAEEGSTKEADSVNTNEEDSLRTEDGITDSSDN